ncbi:MAG: hypothetical protein CO128_08350 [Ignavibacteriales bacterium CG_4_9_14_3_um_filter_30_11]|nr:MAG: hypothetical protein CO128_08350 [Ignavibacteriales bacterium CG_4_9_14_3_um_filter_30_11]
MNKNLHAIYVGLFFLVGVSITVLLAVDGFKYYNLPIEQRFFSSQHTILKPSGFIGHGLGIFGTLMMIFGVAIYMIRKRTPKLLNFGYLKYWLEFHIFLCTLGPILVLYHTAFKFGGLVSVSFWSMVAVVLSGVVGRFIYLQIPRTIQGQEVNINELSEISDDLTYKLKKQYNVDDSIINQIENIFSSNKYSAKSAGYNFLIVIKEYFGLKVNLAKLKKQISSKGTKGKQLKEIIKIIKSKIILNRRIGMLRSMQKLFRYWHIIHLPFAITMLVIMLVHVAVTIILGYKWIF